MKATFRGFLLLSLVVLLQTGCSSVHADLVPTSEAKYRAYGDSITRGSTLGNPANQAYPSLVADYEFLPFANNAIPGDQACDVPKRQIFPNGDSPDLEHPPVYSLLIGTNDVDIKGVGAYESIFMLCHLASLSWLAIPKEYKVLATDSSVVTQGPGLLDSSNSWNSWTSGGSGSSIQFRITTTRFGPLYAWPRISDSVPATYAYFLDGVQAGFGSTAGASDISTQNGTSDSLGFLRLDPVNPGEHTLLFVQTSAGPNGFSIVGVGAPSGTQNGRLPIVLAGTIPYQSRGAGHTACAISDEPCVEYNKDILRDVELLDSDGLDVRLFDTRKYMLGTSAEMNDSVHPNALGQRELARSVESVWPPL